MAEAGPDTGSMPVLVEFSIPSADFPFGRSTSGGSNVKVRLERFVPLSEGRLPFLWARDGDLDGFEAHLRESPATGSVEALTRTGTSVLYAVEWCESEGTFLNGLTAAGGSIMEGHGDDVWSFTVRFRDHASLTQFHQFYQEETFPVHIDQVSTLSDEPGQHYGWALTPAQRRAVLLALDRGYYSVPRETKLEEIAGELDITRQAASELVRRGTQNVLERALAGFSAADFLELDEDGNGT